MTSRRRLLAAALVLATAPLLGSVTAAHAVGSPTPPPTLPGADGTTAGGVTATGVHVPRGWTPSLVDHLLATDASLKTSHNGKLYFVDRPAPRPALETAAGVTSSPPVTPIAPLDQTFKLHSKPGAQRVIYLDFNGDTVTGTDWNTLTGQDPLVVGPMDFDGNPASFSDAELAFIQDTWSRVADDYDMFQVDVTTEEPPTSDLVRTSASDQRYGQRVVITNTNFYEPSLGVAFVGTFGDGVVTSTGDTADVPAFVFTLIQDQNGVEQSYTVPYAVAQGASHEAGHTLGLHHDGLVDNGATCSGARPDLCYYFGTPAWGPIMGGAGVAQYVTWSKGEYPNANNPEDDLAVMAANGAPPEPDVVGNTIPTAAPLAVSGNTASATGRLETRSDVDVYSFGVSGHVDITVAPSAPFEPNLDLAITVLRPDGSTVASANPPGRAAPNLSLDLPGGTYFLSVDGVGQGNPAVTGGYSDYASLGRYQITVTASTAPVPVNQPPSAVGSGAANGQPLQIAFSSAGSSDPEGQALGFSWTFGDGTSSTDANPVHTYPRPGAYTATLTVTDTGGIRASVSVPVTVADPAKNIRISSISAVRVSRGVVRVRVTIVDGYGRPVRGAVVRGRWSTSRATSSATTSSAGVATFVRYTSKPVGFTTSKVTRTGRVWDGVNVSSTVAAAAR